MTSEPATGLVIGARIGARFEVLEEDVGGAPARAFVGVDRESRQEVLLIEVGGRHAAALERVIGLEHRHLARVLAVERVAGLHVLVAERRGGLSLEQRLSMVPKRAAVDAVRLTLRLADALSAIHERGGVHGLMNAAALVVAPDDGPRPLLGFAPGAAAALRAPDGSLDEPTQADDAWAAAALLHWMITGHAPPEQGYADLDAVRAAGVEDETLAGLLERSLARDAGERPRELKPLRRELARWFVEQAGEDPSHTSIRPWQDPPPLPASTAPSAPPVATRSRRVALLAAGALSLGVAGGWALSAWRKKPAAETPIVKSVARSTQSAPPAISVGEVPVLGDSARLGGDKLLACVAGYLPKDTFARREGADVSWLCSETSPRVGAEKLRVALVASAPRSGPSAAMKVFARIGWYDMAALAVVRAGCCPDAPALAFDKLAASCPRMDEALREVGDAVVDARPARAALERYTAAIHCELNAGHGPALGRTERPVGGEDSAFYELVSKLEGP